MICNPDYPKDYAKKGIGKDTTIWSKNDNSWDIYCNGSAQNIFVGAIAISGVIISL